MRSRLALLLAFFLLMTGVAGSLHFHEPDDANHPQGLESTCDFCLVQSQTQCSEPSDSIKNLPRFILLNDLHFESKQGISSQTNGRYLARAPPSYS